MAQYSQLWNDVTSTTDKAEAVLALSKILTDKAGKDFILHLRREEAERCIEVLDRGIVEPNLGPAEKHDFFVVLRRLVERHRRLPDRMMITENIEVTSVIPTFDGYVGPGMYKGLLVAVKTSRFALLRDLEKISKRFCKEVVLWSVLSHPNILELVGVQIEMERGRLTTVSKWMGHRNIMEFTQTNHVNRLELLHGASHGLEYLHSVGLAHGNLRGTNILVSNEPSPRPCLADFDFIAAALDPARETSSASPPMGGMTQFTAPELLVPGDKKAKPTPQADIYAFGMTIFQVLTGGIPFPGVYDIDVAYNVLHGEQPSKPGNPSAIGFSDSLWTFTELCWGAQELRPNAKGVVVRLGEAAAGWGELKPPLSFPLTDSEEPMPTLGEFGEFVVTPPHASRQTATQMGALYLPDAFHQTTTRMGAFYRLRPSDTPGGHPESPTAFKPSQGTMPWAPGLNTIAVGGPT